MKWLPISNDAGIVTHWKRECGRYTVDHADIPGSATGKRYCAWFKSHAGAPPELLDCKDDLRAATEVCNTHLRNHQPTSNDNQAELAL